MTNQPVAICGDGAGGVREIWGWERFGGDGDIYDGCDSVLLFWGFPLDLNLG